VTLPPPKLSSGYPKTTADRWRISTFPTFDIHGFGWRYWPLTIGDGAARSCYQSLEGEGPRVHRVIARP
jgi:hypothetical protein